MTPSSNPPAPAGGLPSQPGTTRRPSAAQAAFRRRVEPVIPLTFLRHRSSPSTATSELPASPLRPNANAIPISQQQTNKATEQKKPEDAQPLAASANGVVAQDKPTTPASPQEHELDAAEATRPPRPEARAESVDIYNQDTASPSQPPSEFTPSGTELMEKQSHVEVLFSHAFPDAAPRAPSTASIAPLVSSPPPPPPFTTNTMANGNMRQPFYPANNTHPVNLPGSIPEPIRLPTHSLNHSRVHQHQLSNGSMVFGGFNGSSSPSPHPHSGSAYPPPLPIAPEQLPVASVDVLGRPVMVPAPIDVHVPVAMNHGPLTPHSLHGSHSSRADEFVPKVLPVNGINGADVGRPGPPPGVARHAYYPGNRTPYAPDGFDPLSDVLSFADFISSRFARPDFADCEVVLEIPDRLTATNSQFPGALNGPLSIPAHRIILSQHPAFNRMIYEHAQQGDGSCAIRIHSDDPFLRPDSMWRAIQYLYGCRYVPLPPHLEAQPDTEKFHFALGYAAAGACIEVPFVSISALREASKLLSWDTVEKGLEFALTGLQVDHRTVGVPHGLSTFRFKHGVYVSELVDKIVMFLTTFFPPNFVLDTTVEDPNYARLPALPADSTAHQNANEGHGNGSRMSNINIKFGDMDLGDGSGYKASPATQQSGEIRSALSRMLLNLPFELLKLVLDSNSLGSASGWPTYQERRRIITEVVAQRESRRLRFLSDLKAGKYQSLLPLEQLREDSGQVLDLPWYNACWREDYVQKANDLVTLERVWTSLELGY
ncbi:hypothetical protein BD289DRAFT_453537 [Coniella lustricola]|uniref:BTB domain-containing protein n=1 Tax=Coniella lustricola TaxID=2025994 RepID=A0A2T3A746_9PEZI|nr:hypothetical protein BD289DRAFT_453537 [Coniella lustricola]